jgi:hypothetical protein
MSFHPPIIGIVKANKNNEKSQRDIFITSSSHHMDSKKNVDNNKFDDYFLFMLQYQKTY